MISSAYRIMQNERVTFDQVAAVLGITRADAEAKICGNDTLTVAEAFRLRDALFPKYRLEELYSSEQE